ncbi:NAD(P)/FAD-dependent oxidoreductase [Paenibacillus kobensis]|uniref:NAD(P)/FAD-dependent oxidoreductase n=1 Tax=Paenibacillus kobensis TaxID=59841 RepID=UPI000FD9EFB7|nr:NAD(P)/FAD-dependent oxidoreductase [Paenibacillus kobensis]
MYDVAIVGARCGGAALAAFLGRLGYRVLLVDRYARPGATLSTHLIGETDVYERLGIRKRMENAGAPSITRMRVDLNGTTFESDIVVTSRVIGLRRELFDPMLLDSAAIWPTVDIRLKTTVQSVARRGEATYIKLSDRNGCDETVKARVIIGADGRHSIVAEQVCSRKLQSVEYSHGVLYVYVEGLTEQVTPAVEWYWHKESIVIVNPIDKGMHCIAVMLPQAIIELWGSKPIHNMLEWLQQIRMLAPRISHMRIISPPRGLARIQGYLRECYGPGWALVGDAGAHLHPVSGVGIDNAVCCAEYLASALHNYLSGQELWEDAMQQYTYQRDERICPQYNAALLTLARTAETILSESEERLKMICTFPSFVHGMAEQAQQVYTTILEGMAPRGTGARNA